MQRPLLLIPLICLPLLAACQREATSPVAASHAPAASATPAKPVSVLKDVVEHDPRYIVGISYPLNANVSPALAAELKGYADAAHAELMQAVEGMGNDKPPAPYDLSLAFTQIARTPDLIAIAADGSSYTGGAHGNPLVARFVWLPRQDKRLTAAELIPQPVAMTELSSYVREQLHAALSQRLEADEVAPAARADILKSAGRMIDEGTAPEAGNFDQFEPLPGADGRVTALRFVFPPYQVGPYADGTQTVDVPADVLLPKVAPAYRGLFVGG